MLAILISGSHQWRATHSLVTCLAILINDFDLLKHLRVTHSLDVCSVIFVNGSNILKH